MIVENISLLFLNVSIIQSSEEWQANNEVALAISAVKNVDNVNYKEWIF